MNTKMTKISLAIGFALLAASTSAIAVEYKPHAICDKDAGFCADWEGVSVALTKMYLGDRAEAKLMARIKEIGLEYFDPTEFTMTGGLTCHTKEKLCWTTRLREKLDAKAIKILFNN